MKDKINLIFDIDKILSFLVCCWRVDAFPTNDEVYEMQVSFVNQIKENFHEIKIRELILKHYEVLTDKEFLEEHSIAFKIFNELFGDIFEGE